jgi:hypothetical protein
MKRLSLLFLLALLLVACAGTAAAPPTEISSPVIGRTSTLAPGSFETPSPVVGATAGAVPTKTPSPVIGPTSTPTLDEIADQEYRKLKDGTSAFNPPENISLGEVVTVRFRISKTLAADAGTPSATLIAGMEGNGNPIIEPIKVGTLMTANLAGDKFKITPLSNEEQLVVSEGFNEWAWTIEPLEAGTHFLVLSVAVRVRVGDSDRIRDFPIKTKNVQISVSWLRSVSMFVKDNWKEILGFLIPTGGGAAWLYQRFIGSRSKRKEGPKKKGTRSRKM